MSAYSSAIRGSRILYFHNLILTYERSMNVGVLKTTPPTTPKAKF